MNAAIHPSGCFESERSIGILHFTYLLFRVQQFISLETGRNRPRGPVFMKAESSQFIGDQQRVDTGHLILVTKGYTIIKVAFTADTDGKMMYRVTVNDTLLLDNSPLGFEAKDGIDLNRGFRVVNTVFTDKDEIWTQPWGENKTNRNHYNEMAVLLKNAANVELTLPKSWKV